MNPLRSLSAYAERIGAERLNFKRYMVKEHAGAYYKERVLIEIDPKTGSIRTSNPDYDPTDDERVAIEAEAKGVEWPCSVPMDTRAAQDQAKRLDGTVYLLPSVDRKKVIMLQQRFIGPDGKKVFVPWSFWSEEGWLPQEPDGPLPFWKPEKSRGKDRIMIHEGAKAAMSADNICSDITSQHPWAEELRLYEHWGMIGGALAPHRSDYTEIKAEKPSLLVYVCDNDKPGMAVLKTVSSRYSGTLKGIFFDPRWKGAWDLAEDMPEKLFAKKLKSPGDEAEIVSGRKKRKAKRLNGEDGEPVVAETRWIGQTLSSMMKPATHATKIVTNPKGKPSVILSPTFAEEWVHSVTPDVYIHVDRPNVMMSSGEFNSFIRPYSDAEDTARLIRTDDVGKGWVIKYDPTVGPGLYISEKDGRYFNTFVGANIVPIEGDARPWTEFMEHLIPVELDRHETYRWCCTLACRPEIKMRYGLLLQSITQGVGKGTLGEKIMTPLVGELNTSEPSERTLVESQFNDWVAHKRLAVCHEIYAGHSSRAYNVLKSYITEDYIEVNKKFLPPYSLRNWIHVLACSNSTQALKLSLDDRRWLAPKVTDEKMPAKFWMDLNRWLIEQQGINIIRWWMERWLEENGAVDRADEAPLTMNKIEMVEEGYSPGKQLVSTFLTEAKKRFNGEPIFMIDTTLVELIKQVIHEGRTSEYLERPLTIRTMASSMGYHVSKNKVPFSVKWGQGATNHARMILSSVADAPRTAEELESAGRRPLDVMDLARKWGLAGTL